jgi:hypothetical protein
MYGSKERKEKGMSFEVVSEVPINVHWVKMY